MSSISPPSHTASPAMLWPPPLIDSGRPCSRAARTQATTSAVPRHAHDHAPAAGRSSRSRSIAPRRMPDRPARAPGRARAPSKRWPPPGAARHVPSSSLSSSPRRGVRPPARSPDARRPSVVPVAARGHEVGEHELGGLTRRSAGRRPGRTGSVSRPRFGPWSAPRRPPRSRRTGARRRAARRTDATSPSQGCRSVPKASCSARAALAPMQAMLPAYDGYGGVVINGSHVASGSVAGLRSSSASRIAVTGRQRP